MTAIDRFRLAMTKHWDKPLTPEIAAEIEAEAFAEPDNRIDPAQFGPQVYEGIVFAVEPFASIRAELHLLHMAHWTETERARGGLPMKPDYAYMEAAERRGELLQFTARKHGALVGNIRMYVYTDLHTGTRAAREDTLFLMPRARVGLTASVFVGYAERCLAQIGCLEVTCDTKILFDEAGNVTRDVGSLLKRRGYQHVANKYLKRISKENDHVL